MTTESKEKLVPVDAVQELADKAAQSASIGGTAAPSDAGIVDTQGEPPPPHNLVNNKFKLM